VEGNPGACAGIRTGILCNGAEPALPIEAWVSGGWPAAGCKAPLIYGNWSHGGCHFSDTPPTPDHLRSL